MTNGDAIVGIIIVGFIAVWAGVILYHCVREFRRGVREGKAYREMGGGKS